MDITALRSRGAISSVCLGGLDAQTVGVPLEQHQGQREMRDEPASLLRCRNGLHTCQRHWRVMSRKIRPVHFVSNWRALLPTDLRNGEWCD
jgi:hypothetical protein